MIIIRINIMGEGGGIMINTLQNSGKQWVNLFI